MASITARRCPSRSACRQRMQTLCAHFLPNSCWAVKFIVAGNTTNFQDFTVEFMIERHPILHFKGIDSRDVHIYLFPIRVINNPPAPFSAVSTSWPSSTRNSAQGCEFQLHRQLLVCVPWQFSFVFVVCNLNKCTNHAGLLCCFNILILKWLLFGWMMFKSARWVTLVVMICRQVANTEVISRK